MSVELESQLLAEVVGQTLEDATFTFTEVTGNAAPFDGDVIEARLGYDGPASGEIRLASGTAFADALAANLLGVEPDSAEAASRGAEAIGEMLNMVCGVLLVRWFGHEVACRLGLPMVRVVPAATYEAGLAGAASRVSLVDESGQRIDAANFVPGTR